MTKEVVAGEVARLPNPTRSSSKNCKRRSSRAFSGCDLAAVRTTMEEVVEASCRKSIAEINQQIPLRITRNITMAIAFIWKICCCQKAEKANDFCSRVKNRIGSKSSTS